MSTEAKTNTGVVDPQFITATKTPANRRPFKLIRKDNAMSKKDTTTVATRSRRIRRSDSLNKVLGIVFPATMSEETAMAHLDEFGLGEDAGYSISVADSGAVVARRSDTKGDEKTIEMLIHPDGIKAVIARSDAEPEPVENSRLTVSEITFSGMDKEQIEAFLTRCDIDTATVNMDTASDDEVVVQRSEVAEGSDTRKLEVEPGVVFTITRSDKEDIPEGYIEVVNEEMYGNYGWGQLDFMASMADKYVCDALEDARYRFSSVIEKILFYSYIPVDARKALVTRAASQYADYINGLLDMLPRQVLVAVGQVQRSDTANKEKDMGTAQTQAKPQAETTDVTRTDNGAPATTAATTAAAPAAAAAAPEAGAEMVTLARADFDALLDAAVKRGQDLAQVSRSDNAADPANPDPAATQTEDDPNAPVQLSRADVKALMDKIDSLGTVTIVRSDTGDSQVVVRGDKDTTNVKRSDNEVFAGALGGVKSLA